MWPSKKIDNNNKHLNEKSKKQTNKHDNEKRKTIFI